MYVCMYVCIRWEKRKEKRKRGTLVMKELIPYFSYESLYIHSILREATLNTPFCSP